MTSLIQACKILTALLTLNNSSSLLCCPPFPLTALSSSSFHSISLPLHFFPFFYTLSYLPFASMFLPEQRRLKCEVSINPVACKSFCLLQWLPQARWWGQWSDCHTRTHTHTHTQVDDTVRLHVRWGRDKMAGNRKLIYLSIGALTHAHTCTESTHTHTHKHLHSCSCLSAHMKGEANAERERGREWMLICLWERETGEDKVIT